MPRVVAYEDAKENQFFRRGTMHTPFLEFPPDFPPEWPVAFLSQGVADRVIRPHYHLRDEFLVVTEGNGKLGRTDVEPYTVFFASAFTPYGPLVGGSERGVSYFVLFPHYEFDAQYLPEKKQELVQKANRQPLQLKCRANFDAPLTQGVKLDAMPDIKDDRGLAAYTLSMGPNEETLAPDPCDGDGQYLLVIKGSLWHGGRERKAYTIVFVEPKEGAFPVKAGDQGLQALILNYPRSEVRQEAKVSIKNDGSAKQWH